MGTVGPRDVIGEAKGVVEPVHGRAREAKDGNAGLGHFFLVGSAKDCNHKRVCSTGELCLSSGRSARVEGEATP